MRGDLVHRSTTTRQRPTTKNQKPKAKSPATLYPAPIRSDEHAVHKRTPRAAIPAAQSTRSRRPESGSRETTAYANKRVTGFAFTSSRGWLR